MRFSLFGLTNTDSFALVWLSCHLSQKNLSNLQSRTKLAFPTNLIVNSNSTETAYLPLQEQEEFLEHCSKSTIMDCLEAWSLPGELWGISKWTHWTMSRLFWTNHSHLLSRPVQSLSFQSRRRKISQTKDCPPQNIKRSFRGLGESLLPKNITNHISIGNPRTVAFLKMQCANESSRLLV